MSTFVEALVENDADLLEQDVVDELETQFEGWTPAEGALATWLIKAFVRIASTVRDQAASISAAAFKKFGETVVNVPPILAAPASGTSTWTAVDDAGYTIPAGTEVKIDSSGDESVAFRVVEDVTIPPASTSTEAGEVVLEAIEPGELGNGLTADPDLISALTFVASIDLVGSTSGGVDEEEEDAYLDRLTEELQLLSLDLIIPRDFEIDARSVAGIARALCVPGYNAETEEEDVPLAVTVFPVDEDGAKLSAKVKEELQERQEAKVPSGVLNFVDDPEYTKVKVKATVAVLSGHDPATVKAAVEARLNEYLDPANWGVPPAGDGSSSSGWELRDTVYRFELVSVIDGVVGVDRVTVLELAEEGKAFGTADVPLKGVAPLTEAGALTVSTV